MKWKDEDYNEKIKWWNEKKEWWNEKIKWKEMARNKKNITIYYFQYDETS